MRISILLTHPNPDSFNHAIAQTVRDVLKGAGHGVILHDLYKEGFDPNLPHGECARDADLPPEIRTHCEEISNADGIVIVHPNWWGMPPAVLKGWIDRVMRPGVAYEFLEGDSGEGVPRGLLKARAALVLNTADTSEARERDVFGDPLDTLWKNCVFGLCGVSRVIRRTFTIVVTSTEAQRRRWLEEARTLAARTFQ